MTRDEQARELIIAGKSNLEVAAALGVRPNYIPKLKRRLGFGVNGVRRGHGRRARKAAALQDRLALKYQNVPPPAHRDYSQARFNFGAPKKKAAPQPKPKLVRQVPPNPPATPYSGPKKFADLKPRQCRWFTGPITRFHAHEALCCAAEVVPGRPYCHAHNAKATDKRKTEESREKEAA